MRVKVDADNMMLKIMDCDVVEGLVLESANGKTIELALVEASDEEVTSDKKNSDTPIPEVVSNAPPPMEIRLTKQDLENMLAQLNKQTFKV